MAYDKNGKPIHVMTWVRLPEPSETDCDLIKSFWYESWFGFVIKIHKSKVRVQVSGLQVVLDVPAVRLEIIKEENNANS